MSYQLEQLKAENHAAESDFQIAVKNYLLNPLESNDELQKALSQLFESVARYRMALRNLENIWTTYASPSRPFQDRLLWSRQ
jgi:hypothetical protein